MVFVAWRHVIQASVHGDRTRLGYVENGPGVEMARFGKVLAGGRCRSSSGCRSRGCGSCRGSGNSAALGVARISAVETRALENNANAVELLTKRTLAFWALRQGAVRKGLDDIKGVVTVFAGVCVSGH